jgi:predicted amidohydrolase
MVYDNVIYVVFSNPTDMEDDKLKNGCSMIIDPFGDILAVCRSLNNDIVTLTIILEKIIHAGVFRFIKAGRSELHRGIIGQDHKSE